MDGGCWAETMFSFSAFLLIGSLGGLFSNAGVALVLNKLFGPAVNAALGIGTQVYNKAIVVAQAVMIVASLLAMRMAAGKGYWLVLLISFAALPLFGR